MPGRSGHAATGAVRHRIGRAAGRFRPGQLGGDGATPARCRVGQRPWRGGLVSASAAGRVAQLRGARRRGAHRPARGCRGCARRAGQNRLGGRGIRLPSEQRWSGPADDPPGSVAPHVRHPQGAQSNAAWLRSANCGRCETKSRNGETSHRVASCPTRRSSMPQPPTRRPSTTWSHCRSSAEKGNAAARPPGWRRSRPHAKTPVPPRTPSRPTARPRRRAGPADGRRPPSDSTRPVRRCGNCQSECRCRPRIWSRPN